MVLKSGTRTRARIGCTSSSATPRSTRESRSPQRAPEKPMRQRHQFGGTLGGPLRLPRSFYFVSARRHQRPRGGHAPGPRADRGGARRRFQRVGCRGSRSVHRPAVSRRCDSRRRASARPACGRGALYPVPNRADPQANFVVVAAGRPDRRAVHDQDRSHRVARQPADAPLQLQPRRSRTRRFPSASRNLPGFGISVLDQGHNFGAGLTKRAQRRASSTSSASA